MQKRGDSGVGVGSKPKQDGNIAKEKPPILGADAGWWFCKCCPTRQASNYRTCNSKTRCLASHLHGRIQDLCSLGGGVISTEACVTLKVGMPALEDGGFHEVHVNTMEGFCSWVPGSRHQEFLKNTALYLGFFEFVHNAQEAGWGLLSSPLDVFSDPWNPYWASIITNARITVVWSHPPWCRRSGRKQEQNFAVLSSFQHSCRRAPINP